MTLSLNLNPLAKSDAPIRFLPSICTSISSKEVLFPHPTISGEVETIFPGYEERIVEIFDL